jgi:hypothetical protein
MDVRLRKVTPISNLRNGSGPNFPGPGCASISRHSPRAGAASRYTGHPVARARHENPDADSAHAAIEGGEHFYRLRSFITRKVERPEYSKFEERSRPSLDSCDAAMARDAKLRNPSEVWSACLTRLNRGPPGSLGRPTMQSYGPRIALCSKARFTAARTCPSCRSTPAPAGVVRAPAGSAFACAGRTPAAPFHARSAGRLQSSATPALLHRAISCVSSRFM